MLDFLARLFRKEKRRTQRFRVEDLVPIFLEKGCPRDVEIRDLSLGGISFVYEDTGRRFPNAFDMDIKCPDASQLGKVRVKTISDVEIFEALSNAKRQFRQFSGHFINISLYQESKLLQILQSHAAAAEPDA